MNVLVPPRPAASPRGFMLLEIILAVSLMSAIAVSLTVALSRLGDSAVQSQREMAVLRTLESFMTETLRNPELEEMTAEWPEGGEDAWGVRYLAVVEPMEMTSSEDVVLNDMYRIVIRAQWIERGVEQQEVMETYRYLPLYSNGNVQTPTSGR